MGHFTYKHTFYAACTGYIVQAVVNNLAPLLFIAFQDGFGLTRLQITSVITVNFLVQLLVDLVSVTFVDKIGYRASAVLSQALAVAGLVSMGVMPFLLPDAYTGLMISVILCALGGGMLEVIISPIVEALPTQSKSGSMSLLHSFYCWGCVGVILLSTLYFSLVGIAHWRWLPLLWALLPAANLLFFLQVPIRSLIAENGASTPLRRLLGTGMFWVLFALMLCSGASEQAMSQWASLFAEAGLGVSKTLGDLFGPCLFAVLMGLGRAYFGTGKSRLSLEKAVFICALVCMGSYLLTVFSPVPLLSLLGCGLCGLSVAVFWPGVFSLSSREFPYGGTAMFAILSLGGDFGCSFGPSVVGWVSAAAERWFPRAAEVLFPGGGAQTGLKSGLLVAVGFPLLLAVLILVYHRKKVSAADGPS